MTEINKGLPLKIKTFQNLKFPKVLLVFDSLTTIKSDLNLNLISKRNLFNTFLIRNNEELLLFIQFKSNI